MPAHLAEIAVGGINVMVKNNPIFFIIGYAGAFGQ
jgi:hypothetical protein